MDIQGQHRVAGPGISRCSPFLEELVEVGSFSDSDYVRCP
jgi:hypothetical protein